MNVLVLNCGSSSLKVSVLDPATGERFVDVLVERIGEPRSILHVDGGPGETCPGEGHDEALAHVLPRIRARLGERTIDAVGHRVVHGGEQFVKPVRIDDAVEQAVDSLSPLAPLHNPENLAGIRAARHLLPAVPHVAVFDTAFHATLPPAARTYALPAALSERRGLRRYGFHGPSHGFVAARAAEHLGVSLRDLRLITCHLGNGCSITAIEYGRSVETSMGMTPLEGLVMGTRAGDVDAGVLIALLRDGEVDVDGLDDLLNRRSGLEGLSGAGHDLRDIERRAAEGDERCRLAIQVFTHRLRKYIGAYAAVMGGVDGIVFTGGIGEHSAEIRGRTLSRLDFLGVRLNEDRNQDAEVDDVHQPVCEISSPESRVKVLVVATDEERAIARHVLHLLRDAVPEGERAPIPVAVSARHVHLDRATCDALFGAGHPLHPEHPLTQPGQFASWERVTLVGPKGTLERVRVVGPLRDRPQVEVARTDEFTLGIDAPIRVSGDLDGTPGILLRGPEGEVRLDSGLICAQRHIHMTPEDAARYGVHDKDVVEVALDTEGRDVVYRDVAIRVKPTYKLEMHVDTDEGNAAELTQGTCGVLEPTEAHALMRGRDPRYDSF